MGRIYLVRHAESIANSEGLYQGQGYDTDLSELGIKQATALSTAIPDLKISNFYISPLTRSIRTAQLADPEQTHKKDVHGDVLEVNHGLWEGKSTDYVKTNYPKGFDLWHNNPSFTEFPSGESMTDVIGRVQKALTNIKKIGENALVLTHDNIIRVMLSLIEENTVDYMWNYNIEPASLNILTYNSDFKIDKLNIKPYNSSLSSNVSTHAL